MEKLVISFLNTKYPGNIIAFPHRTKQGMDAIVWDISTADKDDIFGKCVYYIELKKSFIQVNYGLEKLIMDYFNLGITDVNKIFGTWVTSRLPNIIKINEEHR